METGGRRFLLAGILGNLLPLCHLLGQKAVDMVAAGQTWEDVEEPRLPEVFHREG